MTYAFPVAIHESGDKLGQLLTVLGFGDEAVPRAAHTLVAAQGDGGEAAEDKDQDIIYEDVYFVPLVGGYRCLMTSNPSWGYPGQCSKGFDVRRTR